MLPPVASCILEHFCKDCKIIVQAQKKKNVEKQMRGKKCRRTEIRNIDRRINGKCLLGSKELTSENTNTLNYK